jgi:hypothetical protein
MNEKTPLVRYREQVAFLLFTQVEFDSNIVCAGIGGKKAGLARRADCVANCRKTSIGV